MNREFLRGELGWLPPDDEWEHMVFGRGSADQLSGVVSQVVATKILLETIPQGSLRGAIVRSYATVTEEDNDGAGPMYLMRKVLPTAGPEVFPDAVVLTEGTGDAHKGALGIYRGQRGRMQIEVVVTGRSCHGSMPWEGKNPLEFGGAILAEAAEAYERGDGFLEDPLLGRGTRTASWAVLESPSDCAVPDRFTFRFDRRLTAGETPDQAVADIEKLAAVKRARDAGLTVEVGVPTYNEPTWKGYHPDNPQIYMGWVTPEDHPAIAAARRAYKAVVSPAVPDKGQKGGTLAPRAARGSLDLLHRRRRLPGEEGRAEGARRQELGRRGRVHPPAHARHGPRHRTEHAQDRRSRRRPRAAARDRGDRALPVGVRRGDGEVDGAFRRFQSSGGNRKTGRREGFLGVEGWGGGVTPRRVTSEAPTGG